MPDMLTTRAARFEPIADGKRDAPESLDESARTVVFALATETPARVWDWNRGVIDEVLLMSGAEFPAQIPLLDAHNRYSVESQLGSLRALHVDGAALCATAYFSSVPRAEEAFAKVREGHLTDISVGYTVEDAVWIPEGETAFVDGRTFSGPLRVVRKWRVKEGSLTPIGADEQAKARSTAQPETINRTEAGKMPENTNKKPESVRAAPGNQTAPAASAPAADTAAGGQRTDAPARRTRSTRRKSVPPALKLSIWVFVTAARISRKRQSVPAWGLIFSARNFLTAYPRLRKTPPPGTPSRWVKVKRKNSGGR